MTFPPWKSVWEVEEVPGGGVTVMEGSLRSAWLLLRPITQLYCGQCSPGGGVALCVLSQFSRTMWSVMSTDSG